MPFFSSLGKSKKKTPPQEPIENGNDNVSSSKAPIAKTFNRKDENLKRPDKSRKNKPEDIFMDDPRIDDIVILILGPIGAGKSTFINTVAGTTVTTVGHSLNLETKSLRPFELPGRIKGGRRVILVDTPGFDHTEFSDMGILRRISIWLDRSYAEHTKLAGVIYLHEISQARFIGTPPQNNIRLLNKLCGTVTIANVILATTKWSDVPEKVGMRREMELKDDLWRDMLDLGSILYRFGRTPETGWTILNHIINHASGDVKVQAREANQGAQQSLYRSEDEVKEEIRGKGSQESPKPTPIFRRLFF